jgi:hypothetical protein
MKVRPQCLSHPEFDAKSSLAPGTMSNSRLRQGAPAVSIRQMQVSSGDFSLASLSAVLSSRHGARRRSAVTEIYLIMHLMRRLKKMTIQITVEERNIPFRLDWKHWRWHALDEPQEADFPLIALVDGKRYELYSDGSFAEVEK